MKITKIPVATIMRMSVYSRFLTQLNHDGIEMASSSDIADGAGVTSAQVRKDLAYFGEFGIRGVGYNIKELNEHIRKILHLGDEWRLALVGIGSLGRALIMHKGFREHGFAVNCIFDNDPAKIGGFFEGVEVLPAEKIREAVSQKKADIGVICVPAAQAQNVADALVEGGIKAILNFASVNLVTPPSIHVRNVDLTVQLEVLTFQAGESIGRYG
ncbi:MAG: redox-sensing transcriptional repressor Rex [Gracilibacteraceae bacterium]|nr:redox-sensing transcriptional repressor Rex [Gracilibacteraceae bacterium]